MVPIPTELSADVFSVHRNNFHLLRLLAALQVFVFHGLKHLRIDPTNAWSVPVEILSYFPGVPIFFVISGFLVSRSYENTPTLRLYARKRFLRIYPALWMAFLLGLAIVGLFGFLGTKTLLSREFAMWSAAQVTLLQIYNPSFLREFGVGVLNGSLWTIPVEISFYVFLPLLYRLLLGGSSPIRSNAWLVALGLLSFGLGFSAEQARETHAWFSKIILLTLAPHLYQFLLGVLLQRNPATVERFVAGRFLPWIVGYLALMLGQSMLLQNALRQNLAFLLVSKVLLAGVSLSFAFSFVSVSPKLLGKTDLSYGFYLYHMLVINILVQTGRFGFGFLGVALLATMVLAYLSWTLVESPALRWKTRVTVSPSS